MASHQLARTSSVLLRAACSAAVLLMTQVAAAQAQGFPSRPVMVISPLAPGGPVDTEGRVYTTKLQELTGQPFIMDYKVGAGGTVGIGHVAKAAPDGYTILIGSTSLTMIPALNRNPGFDAVKDFAPISLMTKKPSALLVHPSLPIKSLREMVAYAKAHPGELNFGTTGAGGTTHLAGSFMASLSGAPLTFVHYKGTGPMTVDLLAGRVHLAMTTLISSMSHVKSGKLRVIGVSTLARQSRLPDVPTLSESGAPGYEYVGWTGFLAPARTPAAAVDRLSAAMARVAKSQDVVSKLGDGDIEFFGSTPDYLRKHIADELSRWSKVVDEAGIKPEK